MAYEIGTATDYADLYDRFVSFLTTNSDLVADGQEWEIAWTGSGRMPAMPEDVVLKGSGMAGSDEIFVGLRRIPLPASDRYAWELLGVVGLNPAANTYDEHTNTSSGVTMHFGDFAMPYWFIANGRRFIIIVRVSTTYQVGYGGFIMPYAPPNIWSYPLAVGGTAADSSLRWSDVTNAMMHFADPGTSANLKIFRYDNTWANVQNWSTSGRREEQNCTVAPWNPGSCPKFQLDENVSSSMSSYRKTFFQKIQTTFDGKYVLTPATICQRSPANAQLGVLEGVYHVPGFNMSAETILEYDGIEYLCIPNINRLGNDFFAAYALNG